MFRVAGAKLAMIVGGSEARIKTAIARNQDTVLWFTATWCGPCQHIRPLVEKAASKSATDVVKVDVDEYGSIAEQFKVSSVPSFVLVRNSSEVRRVVGASPDQVTNLIEKTSS